MIVYGDNIESHVPIKDIYSVVIDNRAAYISVQTVTTLARAGAAVYFCDEKHIPTAVNLPLNNHCKPFGVLKKQLDMSDDFKKGCLAENCHSKNKQSMQMSVTCRYKKGNYLDSLDIIEL